MQAKKEIVNVLDSESVYQIEYNIKKLIQNDNDCSTHFEYSNIHFGTGRSGIKLTLITYNPSHKRHFLLHSLEAQTRLMAVKAMYQHIFTLKQTLESKDSPYLLYCIEWFDKKTNKKSKSSFYGSSIQDILMKFYYKRDVNELTLLSMMLLPQPCA